MKKYTCGTIVTDGKYILGCHPTGVFNSALDIPKGIMEEKEHPYETALRELKEETGLQFTFSDIYTIGTFAYNKEKILILFLYEVNILPEISSLKCSSFFTTDKGNNYPEIESYEYVTIDDDRFYKSLRKVFAREEIRRIFA